MIDKKSIGMLLIIIAAVVCLQSYTLTSSKDINISDSCLITIQKHIEPTDPSCLRLYYYIEQYADTFDIPKNYAYGIAHCETGYNGPFDWKYNHKQVSKCGAAGPMQVMPATAFMVNGSKVSTTLLKNDIQYNVKTSMKLLRMLYDKYGDWKIAFGAYNTGHACINAYANRVYDYNPEWLTKQ